VGCRSSKVEAVRELDLYECRSNWSLAFMYQLHVFVIYMKKIVVVRLIAKAPFGGKAYRLKKKR